MTAFSFIAAPAKLFCMEPLYRIAHISDLHFSRLYQPEIGETLNNDLNALDPDLIVISGDLTLWSKHSEFKDARSWLKKLSPPKLIVPGNHDVNWFNFRDQLYHRTRLFKQYTDDMNCRCYQLPGLTVLGLDSTKSFTIAQGQIGKPEINWFMKKMKLIPADDLIIVVFHHHFLQIPNTGFDPYILKNASELLALFQHHRVDMVLTGHRHAMFLQTIETAHPDDGPVHQMIVVNCGTSTSRRYRADKINNYNLIAISPEEIHVTQLIWQSKERKFLPASHLTFPNQKCNNHNCDQEWDNENPVKVAFKGKK